MALVEVRNVSKIYRLGGEEIRALDDVSLDIDAGQFMSIIGPSGSGKWPWRIAVGIGFTSCLWLMYFKNGRCQY